VKRNILKGALAAAALLALGAQAPAQAQAWPQKPVRFIVPFPAGSAPDVMVRFLGTKLADKWGQQVLVENRPGASGVIGMQAILTAPGDGYTFGFAQGSALSVAPATIKNATYEFGRDFAPVGLVATSPFLIAVAADSPYKTLDDLVRAAKAKPGSIEIADNGRATLPHLAAALLGLNAGAEFLHVHYQGGAQAMQATLAGETKAQVEPLVTMFGMVQAGRMRVLASFGDRVEPGLEPYPLATKAFPGTDGQGWYAVVARKDTPAAVVQKANADLNEALARPDVIAKYREFAAYPRPGTPADLARFVAEDTKKWNTVVQRLGIKPE
jgi:tripartite-type tricarboxylate transporter receptor subunit TctC